MASLLLKSLLCFLFWLACNLFLSLPSRDHQISYRQEYLPVAFIIGIQNNRIKIGDWVFSLVVFLEAIKHPEKSFSFAFLLLLEIPRNLYPSIFQYGPSVLLLLFENMNLGKTSINFSFRILFYINSIFLPSFQRLHKAKSKDINWVSEWICKNVVYKTTIWKPN